MIKQIYSFSTQAMWVVLLLVMPITSLPLLATLVGGGNTVASPSVLLLLSLVLVWFIPKIVARKSLSLPTIPLVAFAFYVTFSLLFSMFFDKLPYKAESPLRNNMEAFITLGIGLGFYFVTTWWLDDEKKIKQALQIINWSGLILLIWAGVQAASWAMYHRYPEWVRTIHELYSVGPLFRQRVSGFALEPSWFAHQLNMLYLPLWLAFSVKRTSVFKFRILGLSLENILLVGGGAALFLSYSRVGLAAFLLMVAYVLVCFNFSIIKWFKYGVLTPRLNWVKKINSNVVTLLLGIVLVLGYAGLIGGLAWGLSRLDPRMARLFAFEINRPDAILYYANQLTFASRLVYWQAGWDLFNDYPLFGVGLGNAGLYISHYLSAYSLRLMEVRDLIFRSASALNIKSLWVRLLAETGVVGFSLFTAWLWGLWQTSRKVEKSEKKLFNVLSWMGKFVMIGLLLEGFSLDTFALPYVWFSLGLLTACYENSDRRTIV